MRTLTLSSESEQVLKQARMEAIKLGHTMVCREHLFLAVLICGGIGSSVLTRYGWEPVSCRALLRRAMGYGTAGAAMLYCLSDEARSDLAGAVREAAAMGCREVTPDHLLLSMLRERHSAAGLLRENGTSPELLFSELVVSLRSASYRKPTEREYPMRLLEQFCCDMAAASAAMEPVIGREEEIETVIGILCRKNKNNPALIGEPGVGKTAVVEGLAQRMAAGQVPEQMRGKRLLSVDLASVLAGTKYRGEFEERIRDMVQEVRRSGNIILFIDEMHTLIGAGSAEGAIDAANLLKPALGRGEIQLIGATTLEEYRKYVEKDAALERRFRPVIVREPSRSDTIAMLEGLRPGLEQHHQIRISHQAIEAAVDLSKRYLTERFLPDKAVDLLDEAAARCKNRNKEVHGTEEYRQKVCLELSEAVRENQFEQAASLRDKLQQILRQQRVVLQKLTVEAEDIAETVSQRTGIPVGKVSRPDKERLLHLREDLEKAVMGQPEAVEAVVAAICRGRLGLADSNRPVASMLFLGPTGVGKTALCKALAECVFGSQEALIRLDMSEYMEQHAVSRLLGAPPGYIGHEEGGQLTERVRRRPYCVVLLDELEKAHRDVSAVLLQVMEDGVLTDSLGRHVDFRNTIVVMTSNLGSGRTAMDRVGFLGNGSWDPVKKAAREFFSPEFLGRLDCITTFQALTQKTLEAIAARELADSVARAAEAGAEIQVEEQVIPWMASRCAAAGSGAREIRHLIRKELEGPAARYLLGEQVPVRLKMTVESGAIAVTPR